MFITESVTFFTKACSHDKVESKEQMFQSFSGGKLKNCSHLVRKAITPEKRPIP